MDHNCVFIIGFHMEPGEDGDPIFCDQPAGMQIDGFWYCAEHFDTVEEFQRTQAVSSVTDKPFVYRQGTTSSNPDDWDSVQMGVDVGLSTDETHVALFGIKDETIWQLDASKLTKTKF